MNNIVFDILASDPKYLPHYATEGASCFDIKARIEESRTLWQGDALDCGTGLQVVVPEGHTLLIFGRSGLGFKHGIRLANSVAVIDSDYRGEIRIKLLRDVGVLSGEPVTICDGDRIAQGLLLPIPKVFFNVLHSADDLPMTKRGTGGLGSTGLSGV